MGHHISAIICKPSSAIERAAEFDLPVIRSGDFVIIPMDANHSDAWTERLGLGFGDSDSDLILDGRFAHHVAAIVSEGDYALIETGYFGGLGDQAAAAYKPGEIPPLLFSERTQGGAINKALRAIGVHARPGVDEFITLGLEAYRHFNDYFQRYYD